LLLHSASLPSRDIEEAAAWMARTIVRSAGAPEAKIETVGRKRGRPEHKQAFQLLLEAD
jgi:hypothetical protein